MQQAKNLPKTLIDSSPYWVAGSLLLLIILLGISASFALLSFPDVLTYPVSGNVVTEACFGPYVELVNTFTQFMTTLVGILVGALLLTLALLTTQVYLWNKDRKRLNDWKHNGLVIEQMEFLSGNRLRLNSTEIELNRAQYMTLRLLAEKRTHGESLHPADLPSDNGTQMIKRLREELGGKLMEQHFIRNRRGKGYWAEVKAENIRFNDSD